MSAPKHTPGPWHWNEDGLLLGGNGDQIIDTGSGGEYRPSIGNPQDNANFFWTANDAELIKTPDAVLIAASPKLLAALKGLLVGDVLLLKKYPYWRQEIEKAEAAIVEAEGVQP